MGGWIVKGYSPTIENKYGCHSLHPIPLMSHPFCPVLPVYFSHTAGHTGILSKLCNLYTKRRNTRFVRICAKTNDMIETLVRNKGGEMLREREGKQLEDGRKEATGSTERQE